MNGERSYPRTSASQSIGSVMLAITAPFIILMSLFAIAGIAPFGQTTLLCEHNAQWFSDLAQWRSVLNSGKGLMYSFSSGLGSDFYTRWVNGLSSPFLLIVATMEESMMPQAFTIATLVRASFAGLFSFILLRRLSGHAPLSAAAFAAAYSTGSQFFLSFLAPQYADAAVFLPLAAAGIALLAEKGRATLFFCGAVLFLLCCGRLWPLLIFFSIAYFVWCQLVLGVRDGLWARLGLFVASIAAAFGASMVTLIPTFSVRSDYAPGITPVHRMDTTGVFELLASMFSGAFSEGAVIPLLFCSSITILMLLLYFFNSRLPLGERQVCAVFLLLLCVSMCVPVMCWLWLGFSAPTGTITSCGCIFCLFAVSAAVRLTAQPMRVKVSKVLVAWIICAGLFLASLIFGAVEFSLSAIIFTAAFLTMYAAITIIALSGRGISAGFCIVILVCIGCESILGGTQGLRSAAAEIPLVTVSQQEEASRVQHNLNSIVTGSEQNNPSGFFRSRGADIYGSGRADACPDITGKCSQLMEVLGIYNGAGYTPVTDSLFGIKYTVSQSPQTIYPSVGITDRYMVSRNDNALALCLSSSAAVRTLTSFSTNPFTAQNEFISAMANADRTLFINAALTGRSGDGLSIIETLDGVELVRGAETGTAQFTVLVPADGPLYMFLGSEAGRIGTVSINGGEPVELDLSVINCLGNFSRGSQPTVSVSINDERIPLKGTWFAVLDTALTDTSMKQLSQQNASNISVDGSTVTCTATISEGQILMTSIPWQSGWRAYVNGKETDTICVSGALLGIDPGAGVYDVRLVYEPEEFLPCLILSAAFLLFGFILTCILDSDRLSRMYENSRRAAIAEEERELPPQEDIFATYSSYMIPDIQSLDDQEDDFSDYFNGN